MKTKRKKKPVKDPLLFTQAQFNARSQYMYECGVSDGKRAARKTFLNALGLETTYSGNVICSP